MFEKTMNLLDRTALTFAVILGAFPLLSIAAQAVTL